MRSTCHDWPLAPRGLVACGAILLCALLSGSGCSVPAVSFDEQDGAGAAGAAGRAGGGSSSGGGYAGGGGGASRIEDDEIPF